VPSDFLHRRDSGAHGLSAPFVEKCASQAGEFLEMTSWPMAVKNPWNDSMVRSLPTQSGRVMPMSI
jgi:hypothetical protein